MIILVTGAWLFYWLFVVIGSMLLLFLLLLLLLQSWLFVLLALSGQQCDL